MQYKIYIFILFLSFFALQGCHSVSGDSVTIQGTLTNTAVEPLYIYQLLPASKPLVDSAFTDGSGKFSITLPVKQTGFYTLKLRNGQEITLVLAPHQNITITGNGQNLRNNYRVSGSKDSELYAAYQRFTNANLRQVDSLSEVFAENRENKDFARLKPKLDEAYLQIFNRQKESVAGFVKENLNSLASLLVIAENFGPNPVLSENTHPGLFLQLDSSLFHRYPENSLVNDFHLRMLRFKADQDNLEAHNAILKPGMPAPEISLPNATGTEIKLSSLQGKLTLVYFWSSWNALCRQTNLNLAPIYTRNHNRGFDIFAISVDSDRELWKRAYMLDKAYWTQVIDTSGLKSEYCRTYVVKSLPKLMLIGKDGRIIAHDPPMRELEEMIRKNL
ncbi:MAG: TlpA disulfide reductase family protein [Bacteroidales bacterium]